ncbi:hypothetical protein CFC21_084249 [Triticum aestivum]|uniref:Phytocyanin domain-containing protein n=3 Tax=Triticum TaxID=4564 RepID=A0A9R1B298_TRITD|nr:uclacyanin-2-like [Triticum dicoccoides]XP_044406603.1 uclacyanin-2-like [Triticum aestivum]KAF7080120.1 hypothetical protein CFC21_084249 [Triticum aestivum]VAI48839.1 unnamed protein product [Triticum turgidum subsp. durum]
MARLLPAAALAAVAALAVLASPATAQDAPSALPAPLAYMNHTVGGADGWFFNATSNTTSGNYSSWAAGETFYLGDYLIFKTNDNSSVVVTSNSTTYSLCDPSEDDGLETYIYSGGVSGLEETDAISVPLLYEGTNYFFSEADGGVQCQQGMRFQIKVAHGHGLPPALAHPPSPPPKEGALAPAPTGPAFSVSQGPVAASASTGAGTASDYTDSNNAGCRAVGSRFLGVAIVVSLAFLVAP